VATLVTWDEFTGTEIKGGTIKEIVMSEVANVIARDRPLMAILGTEEVDSLFVERLEDTLGSRGDNAVSEGAPFTAPDLSTASRLGYHVQRLAKWGQVSDEQRDTAHYNEDPFAYQVGKATDELMNDDEHTLHRGTVASGASGTARRLEGLLSVFDYSGTTTFKTDASGTTFTEAEFIGRLQTFKDNNYDVQPSVALVNSWLKRTISEFSTKVTRNVDAVGARQVLLIERHTSDFGDVDIVYTRDQLNAASATVQGNSFIVIDPSMLSVGWFKRPTFEQLSRDGFRDRFQMTNQLTLIYKSRKAGGGGLGYVANATIA
jgi:hypothetical protein